MYCQNKNYLLDLIYNEGNESYLNDIRRHVSSCTVCSENLKEMKSTMNTLNTIVLEKPSPNLFDNILKGIDNTVPIVESKRSDYSVIPVLQILAGLVFIYTIVYLISLKLSLSPLWDLIKNNWIVKSIGSIGIAIIAVLIVGTFFTLSISPILYLNSQQNKRI